MRKLPDPRLHIVYDKDDLVENADFVNSLADVGAGRIVVDVTPDGRNLDWLAVDIERSLGKSPHLSGAGRNTNDRWLRVQAWLIGSGITTMFISRVHLLDARRLKSAFELALACDLEVWLLAQQQPLAPQMSRLLEDWPVKEVEMETFRTRWHRAGASKTARQGESGSQHRFPRVPLDEFVLFRATCRELLSRDNFETVDRIFQQAAAETTAWIEATDAITEEAVVAFIRGLVGPCSSLDEAIVRLRATQVALFRRRYLLKVDLDRVLALYAIEEQSPLDEVTAAKLAQYAATRYPAAAALALATGSSPVELAALNVGDVLHAADAAPVAGDRESCRSSRVGLRPAGSGTTSD